MNIKDLVDDYELPSFTDKRFGETEHRKAAEIITHTISRLRGRRHNHENLMSVNYIKDLQAGRRREERERSRPWNSDRAGITPRYAKR